MAHVCVCVWDGVGMEWWGMVCNGVRWVWVGVGGCGWVCVGVGAS